MIPGITPYRYESEWNRGSRRKEYFLMTRKRTMLSYCYKRKLACYSTRTMREHTLTGGCVKMHDQMIKLKSK
jgi:hypothetical protein